MIKKVLSCLSILIVTITISAAQEVTNGNIKLRLASFRAWTGKWVGESVMTSGPQSGKSFVEESISFRLDSTILLVEGKGRLMNGTQVTDKVVHNALGILSFDEKNNRYRFSTWLSNGRSSEAWFLVTGENRYQWGFDVPGGKIRYTIIIDPVKGTWYEYGEFSRDEKSWSKFMEMNLRKA